jgi:hypothetical protein
MADKNKVGRPLKFKSAKELQDKIDKYFSDCDNTTEKVMLKSGDVVDMPNPKPYTISGLALALDTSRETLINYADKEEYFDTIRKAKLMCENYAEESLWKPKIASGVIFNLVNNYGWQNKQEVESHNINENIEYSDEERQKRLAELLEKRQK